MTAPTPEQMRALASEHAQEAAEYELDRVEKQDQPEYGDGYEYEDKITWHQNTAAALRAAAEQLEAVQAVLDRAESENAPHLYPADIESAFTANTAPPEDRDD